MLYIRTHFFCTRGPSTTVAPLLIAPMAAPTYMSWSNPGGGTKLWLVILLILLCVTRVIIRWINILQHNKQNHSLQQKKIKYKLNILYYINHIIFKWITLVQELHSCLTNLCSCDAYQFQALKPKTLKIKKLNFHHLWRSSRTWTWITELQLLLIMRWQKEWSVKKKG